MLLRKLCVVLEVKNMDAKASPPTTPERRTNNHSPPNIMENYKNDKILAYWVPKDSIKSKRRDALKENRSVSLNLNRSEDRLGCGYKFNTTPPISGDTNPEIKVGHRTKRRRTGDVTCVKSPRL